MTRHERNAAKLYALHAEFRPLVETWLARAEHEGFEPLIVQGRRTYEEQAALYAKGRTAPGPKVTNAIPGRSFHNFGVAIDFVDVTDGAIRDEYDEADWKATDYGRLSKIGLLIGLEWGGLWQTFKDIPHFEWHPGYTASEARELEKWCNPPGFLPANFFAGRG